MELLIAFFFKSRDHYKQVMKKFEEDPRRDKLHKELKTQSKLTELLREEFESVNYKNDDTGGDQKKFVMVKKR